MNKIPSVNLKEFLSDDSKVKQQFVTKIGEAYETIGFVALKGHFLDDALVDTLYSEIKKFFDLPTPQKQKYEIPGIGGQRGYVSFGKESAKGKKEGDLKEYWHFGQFVQDNPELEAEYPKNIEVEELEHFNSVGKEAYRMLEKTAKYVLRALAIYLELDDVILTRIFITETAFYVLSIIHQSQKNQKMQNALQLMATSTSLRY